MKYKAFLPQFLAVLILIFSVSVCAAAQQGEQQANDAKADKAGGALVLSSSNQMETIRSRGTLRVGISIFVPWAMHSNKGELIGYETDVARQLADDLGVKVEFVQTSWAGIITDLLADRYDIIISGLSLTPQRALLINFSEPYGHSVSTILANKKIAGSMKTMEDYNKKEVTIGVVKGSTGEKLLAADFPEAVIKPFDTESQAVAALLSGKLHAMIASTPRTGYLLSRHDKEIFKPFSKPLATYAEGFGVRKGDADFLNYLNTWIRYYTQNGWLAERHHYWFDTVAWADQL
jgi:polar amino acid transport system substrate-binding protein